MSYRELLVELADRVLELSRALRVGRVLWVLRFLRGVGGGLGGGLGSCRVRVWCGFWMVCIGLLRWMGLGL